MRRIIHYRDKIPTLNRRSKSMGSSLQFLVHNQRSLKLIPYIGCKAGFAHIFDSLIPDNYGKKIYDIFGGGGGFTFYACNRFGSKNVIYNDHNPVITNLMTHLRSNPIELYKEYHRHYLKSSNDYYLKIRKMDITQGVQAAGRFFYLAKNAFSGKIRFNAKNQFNCPMRKNSRCPQVNQETLEDLSYMIRDLTILNRDYTDFDDIRDSFLYLDPPYMNNSNGHYNAVVPLDDFISFVKNLENTNNIMISEQNSPKLLRLSDMYTIFPVTLKRSLQYTTQNNSTEIVAINYKTPDT